MSKILGVDNDEHFFPKCKRNNDKLHCSRFISTRNGFKFDISSIKGCECWGDTIREARDFDDQVFGGKNCDE